MDLWQSSFTNSLWQRRYCIHHTQPKDPSVTSSANLDLEVGLSQGTAPMIIPVKLSKKTARETLPSLQRCGSL